MHVERPIPPGMYDAIVSQNGGQIVAEIAEGDHKGEKITFVPKNGEVKNHKQRRLRHRNKRSSL